MLSSDWLIGSPWTAPPPGCVSWSRTLASESPSRRWCPESINCQVQLQSIYHIQFKITQTHLLSFYTSAPETILTELHRLTQFYILYTIYITNKTLSNRSQSKASGWSKLNIPFSASAISWVAEMLHNCIHPKSKIFKFNSKNIFLSWWLSSR